MIEEQFYGNLKTKLKQISHDLTKRKPVVKAENPFDKAVRFAQQAKSQKKAKSKYELDFMHQINVQYEIETSMYSKNFNESLLANQLETLLKATK